jgi:SAM-dependent methyltransferase
MTSSTPATEAVRETVRAHYRAAAQSVLTGSQAGCCGSTSGASCCGSNSDSVIVIGNYSAEDTEGLPQDAVLASLGCGNPTALAQLEPGQTVLDLGSGGGIDVLLSARRVGPTGFVFGLDMTDEMLQLAERNKAAAGVANVSFLKGHIEQIPLPANSVDVIISNCVINLSGDKPAVFREAYRVLRPGGLFAVSDVVVQGELDAGLRADMEAWAGCIAGALEERDYLGGLASAGFTEATIEVTKEYDLHDALGDSVGGRKSSGKVVSGFIRARKPAVERACCGPACCS